MEVNEEKAIELLKKYAKDEERFEWVMKHVRLVQKIALRISKDISRVDIEFIRIACLLHDIGIFRFPKEARGVDKIRHGIYGAEILKKEGLDERYQKVCETHIGAGIIKEEIIKEDLDLPHRDFIPQTIEEKIIAYADKLAHGDEEWKIHQVVERYSREVSEKSAERVQKLNDEIKSLRQCS
ncbi:HD domain-containing protein [Candidatus Woesearchaeota archaeon]|nr:HD domain-containing protein [Candidatus Woesearchaeota archaeon]